MRPLLINTQYGLGDNIFLRPFVRVAAARRSVWLRTPWPELFEDLPVRFAQAGTGLRTQAKNIARQDQSRWETPPHCEEIRVWYGHSTIIAPGSITKALERFLPLGPAPYVFDLPAFGAPPVITQKPLAVVRPVTVRREWRNVARNPLPQYVNEIARHLMNSHHVVAVADLQHGEEWIEGEAPPFHTAYFRGELPVKKLLALTQAADVLVGGVGWIVPASIAQGVKAFVICGGQGGHNHPDRITDPRMNLSKIGFAFPERFCPCCSMKHTCPKKIPNLAAQWNAFASVRTLPLIQ